MSILGILIVVITFVLIIKKYESRMVLFVAGVAVCLIGGLPNDIMKAFTKAMTHNSLVPAICTVMGFSYVMKLTGCDQHLVHSISGLLKKGKVILVPLSFLLTWWIGLALPSASGLSAAVGAILIPTLIAAGVHPAMAAATVLAGTDMMTVIIYETPASIIASLVCAAVLTAYAVVFKEGANEERRIAYEKEMADKMSAGENFNVNYLKALVPVIPLVLLILSSKQVGILPEMSVALSMVLGVVIALVITWSNAQKVCVQFFDGMGSAYGNVIGLIICATVFTSGLAAMGLISTLIELMDGSQSLAALSGTFGPFIIALISGSGDAASFAFNGAVTPYAEQFGMTIMGLGSLAQIAGAIGRAVSPVAGAAIICAGLAKVSPMEVSKRNFLPCVAAAIVLMIFL